MSDTTAGWKSNRKHQIGTAADRGIPRDHNFDIQFPQSPSEALQCLLDTKEGMRRVRAAAQAGEATGPIGAVIATDVDWADWQRLITNIELFFWTPQTIALVTAASASYPLLEESAVNLKEVAAAIRDGRTPAPPSYLPKRRNGLCVFAQPCLYVAIEQRVEPLSAIAWVVGVNALTNDLWLSLRGIAWTHGGGAAVWWSDGGSAEPDDLLVDDTFRNERLTFTKWVCTAAMFIEQEIVAATPASLSRAVARRAAKLSTDPICHVVNLRKELQDDHDRSGDGDHTVDWSHRWLVRGHWRRQFFPSRGGHAPMWIHPHVKGPIDRPFLEPKPTVYAVTR